MRPKLRFRSRNISGWGPYRYASTPTVSSSSSSLVFTATVGPASDRASSRAGLLASSGWTAALVRSGEALAMVEVGEVDREEVEEAAEAAIGADSLPLVHSFPAFGTWAGERCLERSAAAMELVPYGHVARLSSS